MKFWSGAGKDDEPIYRFGLTTPFLMSRYPYLESDSGVKSGETGAHKYASVAGSEEELRGLEIWKAFTCYPCTDRPSVGEKGMFYIGLKWYKEVPRNKYISMTVTIKTGIIFLLFCNFQIGDCQEVWKFGRWKSLGYDQDKQVSISVDTMTHDTIFENFRGMYRKIVSTDGVVLSIGNLFGGMGSDCGCEVEPHGYWVNRNRDNTLKDLGEYYCNRKIGTWYYFNNDSITKIETYSKAHPNFERERNSQTYLNGPYFEFYSNGKLKVEGFYRIIEEYSTTDTTYTFNPVSYEEVINIDFGDFWHPKSVKYGIWKYYNRLGEVIDEKIWKIEFNNKFRFPEMHLIEDIN